MTHSKTGMLLREMKKQSSLGPMPVHDTPAFSGMVLPNVSADLSRAKMRETPVESTQLANKAYVDAAPVGAHTHALAAGATDVTSTAAELNILDGATLTVTELNYVDGVTSAIQTQIDGKSPTTGHASIATVGTITTGVWTGTDIAVPDGGTGAGTFTDAGVLIGNGTSAIQVTTAGTAGQVLTSNGAGVDPTFQAAAGGTDNIDNIDSVTEATNAFSTSSTTLVDVTGMTLTKTVGANRVLFGFNGTLAVNAGNKVFAMSAAGSIVHSVADEAAGGSIVLNGLTPAQTAGSRIYKIQARTTTGTLNLYADSDRQQHFYIAELID